MSLARVLTGKKWRKIDTFAETNRQVKKNLRKRIFFKKDYEQSENDFILSVFWKLFLKKGSNFCCWPKKCRQNLPSLTHTQHTEEKLKKEI